MQGCIQATAAYLLGNLLHGENKAKFFNQPYMLAWFTWRCNETLYLFDDLKLSMLTSCLCFVAFFLHLENDSCTGYSLIPCLAVSWYLKSIDMLRDGGVQWKTHTLLSWILAMMLTWQCLLYLMVMAAGMKFSEFMLKPPSYYSRLLFRLQFWVTSSAS